MDSAALGNKNLIVPECGVTMYQPKFTLLDSVTMTTHPEVMNYAKMVLNEALGKDIKIIRPNENLTKSEVAIACPERKNLSRTCSCQATTRFYNISKPQCGTCYGCVVRRIGMIVAGIDDGFTYRNDIILKDNLPGEKIDNLTALIEFSISCLQDPSKLKWYTREIIEKYKKGDLFERFSMDTIAALLLLREQRKLSDTFLNKELDKALGVFPKESIKDRIQEVRSGKHKPSFNNAI